jgi:hypothetical protein
MKSLLMATVLGLGLSLSLNACGGGSSGPTTPYADIEITPDSTVAGVNYYAYPIRIDGGTPVQVQFSTLGGVWNMRPSSDDEWQTIETRLRLLTSPSYTKKAAEKYLDEMGFEVIDWDYEAVPATYIVLLAEPAGIALSAEVPLLAIVEGYLLRPDLFIAGIPVALSD